MAGSGDDQIERARALHAAGRLAEASAIYRTVLSVEPAHPVALHLLGVAAFQLGDNEQALALIDRALAANPNFPEAHNNRGNVLKALGRRAQAAASYRAAIAANPRYESAHHHLGIVLFEDGKLEEAVASYEAALALRPGFAEARSNLGTALRELGRLAQAEESYRQAIALNPRLAEAHGGLGATLNRLGRVDEALACYDRAIALNPRYVDGHYSRGTLLLSLGRFAEGWPEHEFRRLKPGVPVRRYAAPEWGGEDLRGRTLFCYAEQGLGDTLQFIRFAAELASRGAAVVVEVPRPLAAICSTVESVRIVAAGGSAPRFDCHSPLMSLPLRMGLTLEQLPLRTAYLKASPERIAAWKPRLPEGRLRVGIAWQGNPSAEVDRGRSLPLQAFAPLLAIPGVALVSLQKGLGAEQLGQLAGAAAITDLGEGLDAGPDAFVDTAAVMASLDLVITSDTSIAHLAGALGVPCWVLLQKAADWRWMREIDYSPWYPAMTLFRQQSAGDWAGVMRMVAGRLMERTGA